MALPTSIVLKELKTLLDKLRYGSDIKAVNILLLGLPVDIYTLINHYQTAKEIWDRVKELMEGTEMTKQERESMLYDEFDKFTSEPGESIHSYYLRYAKLINDKKMIPMSMSNMKINTKFENHLQPVWNDLIASLNKAMILLSSAYNSRYPPTNNQLRSSSNPRTQATIQNGQVTVQNVQGRQSQGYEGNAGKNEASGARVVNTVGNAGANQPRVIRSIVNFKADHVDAYDSDCDNEAIANAIFMANLSPVGSINDDMVEPHYDSDILSEVPHYDTYHDSDMLNSNIQELGYIENIVSNNESYDELTSNRNVISYIDYMLNIGNDEDNYVPPLLQKNDMMLRITLSPHEIGSWEQSDIKWAFKKDVIPFSKNLKETFKLFEKGFIAKVKEMKDIFEQMEDEVDQLVVAKKCFEIEKKQLLINNDRLLEENIASDIMCTYLRSLNEVDNCGKCKSLDIVLLDLPESNKSLCEL
ncbi:hypothetical protein Tco_0722120, partial [Tanacetum coccineum]